jgi:hypothetical protein
MILSIYAKLMIGKRYAGNSIGFLALNGQESKSSVSAPFSMS